MTNNFFGFDSKIIELADKAENLCDFSVTDKIKEYNTAKVLSAFINNRVSEQCFYGSSGYGYGDMGRETLDKVYAQAFGTEDALVRHNFVSGTHALSTALWGVLRSGDTMVSVTGAPYDPPSAVGQCLCPDHPKWPGPGGGSVSPYAGSDGSVPGWGWGNILLIHQSHR